MAVQDDKSFLTEPFSLFRNYVCPFSFLFFAELKEFGCNLRFYGRFVHLLRHNMRGLNESNLVCATPMGTHVNVPQ